MSNEEYMTQGENHLPLFQQGLTIKILRQVLCSASDFSGIRGTVTLCY